MKPQHVNTTVMNLKSILAAIFLTLTVHTGIAVSQSSNAYSIRMDIAHGQIFWHDPDDMEGVPENQVDRVRYMTDQMLQTASSLNAGLSYLREEIKPDDLENTDLLFIHIPSATYTRSEVEAITSYLKKGGSLFMVLDGNYWSTLDQTNVNDLIKPFGLEFGGESPDTLAGGYTKENPITKGPMKVTYHGGRIVKGGTAFAYNQQTEKYPFGKFKELESGGKLIVMGDGMVSLYMTSWNGVDDYPCQEFMQKAFAWLLDK